MSASTAQNQNGQGMSTDDIVERKMKVRVLYNPDAAVPLLLDVFNDPDDGHLN